MTNIFHYTHADVDLGSEWLTDVYYNEQTSRLVVVMHGHDVYEYSGVPLHAYSSLTLADSPGGYLNGNIKPFYSSQLIGSVWNVSFERGVKAPSMAAVGTPKALTLAPNATVTDLSSRRVTLTGSHLIEVPKPLSFAHDVVFTIDGGNKEYTHRVNASGVQEAMSLTGESTDALGLDIKVKKVTVHFE